MQHIFYNMHIIIMIHRFISFFQNFLNTSLNKTLASILNVQLIYLHIEKTFHQIKLQFM